MALGSTSMKYFALSTIDAPDDFALFYQRDEDGPPFVKQVYRDSSCRKMQKTQRIGGGSDAESHQVL